MGVCAVLEIKHVRAANGRGDQTLGQRLDVQDGFCAADHWIRQHSHKVRKVITFRHWGGFWHRVTRL